MLAFCLFLTSAVAMTTLANAAVIPPGKGTVGGSGAGGNGGAGGAGGKGGTKPATDYPWEEGNNFEGDIITDPSPSGSNGTETTESNGGDDAITPAPNTRKGKAWQDGEHFEGDIVLTPMTRNGRTDKQYRWKGAKVPYVFGGHFTEEQEKLLKEAINQYTLHTCVRWVPRTNQEDYVDFRSEGVGCNSPVGRVGGRQVVNLNATGCMNELGTPIHEMMHAIGFWHEQSRDDRDDYITIIRANIEPGKEHNFEKKAPGEASDFGVGYDYHSVMHYDEISFSKDKITPLRTMVAKQKNVKYPLGNDDGFTPKDIQKVNKMYRCVPAPAGHKSIN